MMHAYTLSVASHCRFAPLGTTAEIETVHVFFSLVVERRWKAFKPKLLIEESKRNQN